MTRSAMSLVVLAVVMAGALCAPAAAQDGSPMPSASAIAASPSDLLDEMPLQLGGFEPVVEITQGAEHFAHLDPDDPVDRERAAELEGLLEATGAGVEDMVSGYALVSQDDFFSFVVALRIEGAEKGTLLPAYLPILLDDLVEPTMTEGRLADVPVVIIGSEGSDEEPVLLYVHEAGDTLWMLQGPEDVVAGALHDVGRNEDVVE